MALTADDEEEGQLQLPNAQLVMLPRQQEVRAAVQNNPVMKLSYRQACLLMDSLRRSREALITQARAFQLLAQQLNSEAYVIASAHRIVEELVREHTQ